MELEQIMINFIFIVELGERFLPQLQKFEK